MNFIQLVKACGLQLSNFRFGKEQRMHSLIIDTDAGFDDFIAMALLNDNTSGTNENTNDEIAPNIKLISIVPGIQDQPSLATNYFQKNFPHANVITSSEKGEPGGVDWLVEYRKKLNQFMKDEEIKIGNSTDNRSNNNDEQPDCTTMIQDFLDNQSNSNTIDLMCIGPLTNIAKWVADEKVGPLLQQKVNKVWIMGGNIPQQQQQQQNDKKSKDAPVVITPEFNFAQDPIAASEVFTSPYLADKIVVLPAQTCTDVSPDNEIWKRIVHLTKSRNGMISRILKMHENYGHIKYDPLCSYAYMHPNSIKCERLNVEVDRSNGLVSLKEDSSDNLIKFVTHADHYGDDGFLSWFCKAVETEPVED